MNKQKGFSAVIVLLIILVLGAVGFAGYYVYKQQNKNTTTDSNNIPTAQTEQKQPETPTPNLKDYITFNEMGIKAPKESINSNIYYIYDTYLHENFGNNSQIIKVNSKAIHDTLNQKLQNDPTSSTISAEITSCSYGSAGTISKIYKKDMNENTYINQESIKGYLELNEAKDLGDFYLLYTSPQAPCSDIVFEDENLYANQPIESAKKFFNSFTIL